MRTTILAFFLSGLCVASAHGQGTVNFANLVIVDGVRVVDAPVRFYDGSLLSGSMFAAQLHAGPGLPPVGPPTTFLTGAEAGYFSGGTVTINQVTPGAPVVVQVWVWEVATGDRTASAAMTILSGGLNGAPPANLVGLQPFCFQPIGGGGCVPEPSTWLLISLGGVALFCWRWRRK